MTEAYCNCTGAPPWPAMIRLHAGGPNRYYLCRACGSVREDVYRGDAIVEQRWHEAPEEPLPRPVQKEAAAFLEAVEGEQLSLWAEGAPGGP